MRAEKLYLGFSEATWRENIMANTSPNFSIRVGAKLIFKIPVRHTTLYYVVPVWLKNVSVSKNIALKIQVN